MSTETDSPDGEHGSEAEAEKEQQDAPAYVETLEGVELEDPLVIQADGPAVQTETVQDREPDSRNYNLTVEQEVQVSFDVPIKTTGDLEDALLGDNKSVSPGFNAAEAVRWSLEEMDREDLEPVNPREDWDVHITGDPSTYIQIAEQRGDLEFKNSRGSMGLTPDEEDVLEGLHKRGVFCDGLLLAWTQVLKSKGEDYQVPVDLLQQSQEEDGDD